MVAPGSDMADVTLGERELETETGTRVIAIRRAGEHDEWIVQPNARTTVRAGDVLIAKGTRTGAERLEQLCGG